MNLGQMMASLTTWLHETVEDALLMEAISDSCVNLWESMVLINLSEMLGGPATATFAAANQGTAGIVSVADPVAVLVVNQIVQGALPLTNIDFQYTLVTDSGSQTLPGPTTSIARLLNQLASVVSPAFVQSAIGWNLYANGIRQNEAMIPFGVNWVEPEAGLGIQGDPPPVVNDTADDIWYIDTLSVQTDSGEKFWNQDEIGSEIWQKMAGGKASNSPYQPYVYDFDGVKLQIRPLAGGAVSANYFYVRRPRKMISKASTIPFRHPGAELFIRYNSLSLIHLSNHEYPASGQWGNKAEAERAAILASSTRKDRKKHLRVQPLFR